jgi:protein-tyrosine phosphatase
MHDATEISARFVDMHCHLLPRLDDGAASLEESCRMASLAVDDGIAGIVVTPHQMGIYRAITAEKIRMATRQLRTDLSEQGIQLNLHPGAEVRIESDLFERIEDGTIMTIADQRKFVLIELPHDMYIPLPAILERLGRMNITAILAHPERNAGIHRDPSILRDIIRRNCALQITAGSLKGMFGHTSQRVALDMIRKGLVHFVATDAHGADCRRPILSTAWDVVRRLAGDDFARVVCHDNPRAIVTAGDMAIVTPKPRARKRTWFHRTISKSLDG